MAVAIAAVLVGLLATAAKEKVNEHVGLAVDAKDEIKKLQNTFKTLQKVLNDAEQRQFSNESVRDWLDQFKDVAYDMEDVLDEWRTEILRSQIEGPPDKNDGKYKHMIKKKVSSYLCSPFSCFSKAALYYDIGSRIKDIRATLDSIQKDKDQFGFIISKTTASLGFDYSSSERPRTSSIIVDPIFGRDWDKEILLNRLMGDTSSTGSSSNQNDEENEPYGPHNIVSIIGMAGLGKTALSQLIINDGKVTAHFENTMWVCVSKPFDRTRIAQAIIHGALKKKTDTSEWNPLHNELIDSVKGKTFLLVLDDIWTEDENDLNPLKDLLRHGAPGSRIMLTTQKKKVSEIMNSYQHNLGILSPEDCWSLISRKAYLGGSKNKDNEALNNIGLKIARKCNGLPLYASMLGSLLKKKKTESEWRQVLVSKTWELEDAEEKLFKPLLLSYDDLQPPLKRCFAYCAIFPKDYRIKKHTLIRLWMAQGFLNSPRGRNLDPKLIGEKYFDDLAERSFFQDIYHDNDDNGSIIHCKLHDTVHDFAKFLTGDEFYVKHIPDEPSLNGASKARHLTLLFGYKDEESNSFDVSIEKAENLRSLRLSAPYFENMSSWQDSLANLLCRLRCLKVLKLKCMGITRIPVEIKELIHLRYLDLSGNKRLEELPDSICSLYNLETLKLKGCWRLSKLPKGVGKMINLIHLDIRMTDVELSLTGGIVKLNYCSDGPLYIIGSCDQESNMKELKDLNLLQGCIDVRGIGRLKTANEASNVITLKKKQELYRSNINDGIMKISRSTGVKENMDPVLIVELTEGLFGVLIQPQPSLRELSISSYLGLKLTNWITSLNHLSVLHLTKIDNCTELPALGLLPSLKKLSLKDLKNLKRIGIEIYGGDKSCIGVVFPKLKELVIWLNNLEEWDIGDGEVATEIMPLVTSINITSKKLKALPAVWKLSSLETLSIRESTEITHIGPEFYGICGGTVVGDGVGSANLMAFPKLKTLTIHSMKELEEFDFGVNLEERGSNNKGDHQQIITIPRLSKISIVECPKLKTVRSLSKLESLELLNLNSLDNLEEFITPVLAERGGGHRGVEDSVISNMSSVLSLCIWECPRLKSLRQLLHLPKLSQLEISNCSMLSDQLPTSSPNLTSLIIWFGTHSLLPPNGLAGFANLQHLSFRKCSLMTCIPEEVRYLTALQTLNIEYSHWPLEITNEYFSKQDEVACSIMSHIPRIIIRRKGKGDQWFKYELISTLTPEGTRQHSYTKIPNSCAELIFF